MRANDERRIVDGETILERIAKVPPTIVGRRTKAGGREGIEEGEAGVMVGSQGSSMKGKEEEEKKNHGRKNTDTEKKQGGKK